MAKVHRDLWSETTSTPRVQHGNARRLSCSVTLIRKPRRRRLHLRWKCWTLTMQDVPPSSHSTATAAADVFAQDRALKNWPAQRTQPTTEGRTARANPPETYVPVSTNTRAVDQSWATNESSSSCVKPNSLTALGAGGTVGRQDRSGSQRLVNSTYGPRRSCPGPSKRQESCGPPNRALEETRKNPPRAMGAEGDGSWANARGL